MRKNAAGTKSRDGKQALSLLGAIREEIISGAYQPGDSLRQDILAEKYMVSRMPVREALRILETEGLVQTIPNKGARVAPIDLDDLLDIYEMRVSAETQALTLALPEISNNQIARAKDIQMEMEKAALSDIGRLNKEFHMALYQACGRKRLLAHVSHLADASDRYLRLTMQALNYFSQSHGEHHALLDACVRRDEKDAVQILSTHITHAGQGLITFLKNEMKEGAHV